MLIFRSILNRVVSWRNISLRREISLSILVLRWDLFSLVLLISCVWNVRILSRFTDVNALDFLLNFIHFIPHILYHLIQLFLAVPLHFIVVIQRTFNFFVVNAVFVLGWRLKFCIFLLIFSNSGIVEAAVSNALLRWRSLKSLTVIWSRKSPIGLVTSVRLKLSLLLDVHSEVILF